MTTMSVPMSRTAVAEALFVSDLQPSEAPSAEAVRAAVQQAVARYGTDGCAARLAIEFGAHPELAVPRMIWVRQLMSTVGS